MNQDTKDSAVAAIMREPGLDSFLTYLTPEGKMFAGRYRLPGGKLKKGEDCIQTLNRELKEEYKIDLFDIQIHYKKPNVLGGTIFLCSSQKKGEPTRLEKDVGKAEWMSAKEIFESNMVPNCKIAICAYLLDKKPEMIKELYSIITKDQEFLQIATLEAEDLYRRMHDIKKNK